MLPKCANPDCPSSFRYFHEGKLYVIVPRARLGGHTPGCSTRSGQLEYAWLCSACSPYLTIQIDEEFKARVVRKAESKSDSRFDAAADGSPNAGVV